mmetsp:Transcript_1768/g.4492  ORF Transcript_1768/g.4492 Transcript_1768/m.4492 type:complete len:359 (-) Transcript_1768:23-1099(-)
MQAEPPSVAQLASWCALATQLELHLTELEAGRQDCNRQLEQLQEESRQTREATRKASEELAAAKQARRSLRHQEEKRIQEVQVEEERGLQLVGINHGLERSLRAWQDRAAKHANRLKATAQATEVTAGRQGDAEVEIASLHQAMDGMAKMLASSRASLADERAKRLQLKTAVRAKHERLIHRRVSALEILAQNKVEKERWQAEIAAAACELKRAQSNLQEVEKEAQATDAEVLEKKTSLRQLQEELSEAQRGHQLLAADVQAAKAEVAEGRHTNTEAQRCWQLEYMATLDAKIDARRRLDKDIVIAEAILRAHHGLAPIDPRCSREEALNPKLDGDAETARPETSDDMSIADGIRLAA